MRGWNRDFMGCRVGRSRRIGRNLAKKPKMGSDGKRCRTAPTFMTLAAHMPSIPLPVTHSPLEAATHLRRRRGFVWLDSSLERPECPGSQGLSLLASEPDLILDGGADEWHLLEQELKSRERPSETQGMPDGAAKKTKERVPSRANQSCVHGVAHHWIARRDVRVLDYAYCPMHAWARAGSRSVSGIERPCPCFLANVPYFTSNATRHFICTNAHAVVLTETHVGEGGR